jgi:hypothetical protein
MPRRPRLRLVSRCDPSEVFSDLEKLRREQGAPQELQQRRRPLATETFARIPHDKGLALKIPGTAWRVLIELDRLIFKAGGRNPIPFSSKRLRAAGLNHGKRAQALCRLEKAGVILIKRRGRGHSPWVFHTWYPKRD